MNSIKLKAWIAELAAKGELWRFYKSKEWVKLKTTILKENHYECAECRKRGIITRYDVDREGNRRLLSTVHHVKHVREFLELALSKYYTAGGRKYLNLIPVCKACHNKLHPEKLSGSRKSADRFVNEERWD